MLIQNIYMPKKDIKYKLVEDSIAAEGNFKIKESSLRFDGAGYPDGLKGEEIPLESRILALADTFDALTTTRTYRKAGTTREALVEVIKCTYFQSPQFDSVVVEAFLNFLKKAPVKKFLLTDQELQKIKQEAR